MAIDKPLAIKIVKRRLEYFQSISTNGEALDSFVSMIADLMVAAQAHPAIAATISLRLNEMKAEKESKLITVAADFDASKEAALDVLEADLAQINAVLNPNP